MTDTFFEQMANITKAHGYDILAEQVNELKQSNKELVELLNSVVATFALERCEKFELLEKIKASIKKAKILSL